MHMELSWKFIYKIKKPEKGCTPITKTKHVQLFLKDNKNVTFHELKPTPKKV